MLAFATMAVELCLSFRPVRMVRGNTPYSVHSPAAGMEQLRWNLRDPAIGGASQRVAMVGSYLAFPKTAAERKQSGDQRKSIAERYSDRETYLREFARAADELVRQRWILPEDRSVLLQRGGEEWDLAVGRE